MLLLRTTRASGRPTRRPAGCVRVAIYRRPHERVYAPFYATGAGFLDETGEGWASTPGDPSYPVVRTTPGGDTTLVMETRRSPLPVTDAERDSAMSVIHEALTE